MGRYVKIDDELRLISSGPTLPGYAHSIIHHGSDSTVTRPPELDVVTWVGEVEPDNWEDGDIWEAVGEVDNLEADYMLKDGSRAFTGPVEGVNPVNPAHLATKSYTDSLQYGLREVVVFTANGTFEKGNYPWLRAIRVHVVGGGGGAGGGDRTTGDIPGQGGGGGAGGYSMRIYTVNELDPSEPVVIGSGGTGAPRTDIDAATSGGSSTFKGMLGGGGGRGRGHNAGKSPAGGSGGWPGGDEGTPGSGGGGSGGDINIVGGDGFWGRVADNVAIGGDGGASVMSTGVGPRRNMDGDNGHPYGGGGAGAQAYSGTRAGGDGASGIVVLELYG